MEKIYKYIIENAALNRIDRGIAIELLKMLKGKAKKETGDIAIIGISLRFPMANTLDAFWNNIRHGVDCISKLPEERRRDVEAYAKFKEYEMDSLEYQENAYIENIDKFDYEFFKLSPMEASLMDPSQRMFLEVAWNAIEDAGYGGNKIMSSKTGVFVGYSDEADYKKMVAEIDPEYSTIATAGNLLPVIASRIAHILDLKGPNMLINTACSSSLVAIHCACQSIRNGECDMAIAGGVKINLFPVRNKTQGSLGILSSTSRTRTFDDRSDGTGLGEGVAAILLKPLSKAIMDKDSIYAVIKGSAVNQDGKSIGITAPNARAQEAVIVEAWENAGVDPETVTYIEAHGTGTKLGDPIEIEGITRAFKRYTDKKQFCAISSVKSNIGHLDSAAGIAGVIKSVLALKHCEIPPSIHFEVPNREIKFNESPVYISDRAAPWESDGKPRRCGISSFGLSGTNCHVILQQAPDYSEDNEKINIGAHILTISAKSKGALLELIKLYKEFLENGKDYNIKDICYTANTGRWHYEYRVALIIQNKQELMEKIDLLNCTEIEEVTDESIFYCNALVTDDKDNTGSLAGFVHNASLDKEAKQKISMIAEGARSDINLLADICRLYVEGADIEWESLYLQGTFRKIHLPVYPFERKRCWIDIPEKICNPNCEDLLHTIIWEKEEIDCFAPDMISNETIIIFKDAYGIAEDLQNALSQRGAEVIEVQLGDKFQKTAGNRYIVSGKNEEYIKLFQDIKSGGTLRVIYMFTVNGGSDEDGEQYTGNGLEGAKSVLRLIAAMYNTGLHEKMQLVLIADHVYEVTGREKVLRPDNAILFGLGKALRIEHPDLDCKCIDVDYSISAKSIISEIYTQNNRFMSAYRDNTRYIEIINKLADCSGEQPNTACIVEDGVYIVTGGMGTLGIEVAKYLASRNNVNIIIIGRTQLPDIYEWEEGFFPKGNCETDNKLLMLKELKEMGSGVEYYSADVSDMHQIKRIITDIRQRHGKINGIIHCAGVGVGKQESMLRDMDDDDFDKMLAAKVKGTQVLDFLTRNDNLDFFIMFSSVITVTGGARLGGYIAANSYLDAFSAYRNRRNRKTTVINWPTWDKTAVSIEGFNENRQVFKVLATDTAIMCLNKIINCNPGRVIVGQINYDFYTEGIREYMPFCFGDAIKNRIENAKKQASLGYSGHYAKKKEKVRLKSVGGKNHTEVEKEIAQIWSDVLGYKELKVTDNFFDLGGDSILLMQIHSRIDKLYPGKIPITSIFRYPTISKMAAYICRKDECTSEMKGSSKEAENRKNNAKINILLEDFLSGKITIDGAIESYRDMEGKDGK